MNKNTRVTVVEDLVAFIKKNPASSNIIMTSPKFFSRWEQLLLGMFHLEGINVLRSNLNTITVEGNNENKHQPTISLVSAPGIDIVGRRVTEVCVLDLVFLKETKSIMDRFEEMTKDLDKKSKWLERNTPLSFYLQCTVLPVLRDKSELWSVGFNYALPETTLEEIFPKIVIY